MEGREQQTLKGGKGSISRKRICSESAYALVDGKLDPNIF